MDIDLSTTKIFADGADRQGILEIRRKPLIRGFTTNPTLMRAAGVNDYESFALDIIDLVPDRPISFEVFSDDDEAMFGRRQDRVLGRQRLREDPNHEHPGRSTAAPRRLAAERGATQRHRAPYPGAGRGGAEALSGGASYVSVFAGRIADTGRDPVPIMAQR